MPKSRYAAGVVRAIRSGIGSGETVTPVVRASFQGRAGTIRQLHHPPPHGHMVS